MYEMGAKSFVLCCYENEPYTPLLFCARFKQGERVFLVSAWVSRCGICRRQAHVRGVTRWQAVILNYERTLRGESPVTAFPGGRRTYEGWHDGGPSSWIMSVLFGVCFPFDIIGDITAWPRKNGNYGRKLLPTRIQKWTRNFCALFVKLNVDNQNMPNTSYS